MKKASVNFVLMAIFLAVAVGIGVLPLSAKDVFAPPHSALLRVERVINGKNLVLENGLQVRLACLQAPNIEEKNGQMRPGQPLGEEAAETLRKLALGKKLTLAPEPPLLDRHGRRVAHAMLEDGRSVQEEMLKAGMALVYPFADQRKSLPALFAAEKAARAAKRGIWGHDYWKPAAAETVTAAEERYQMVVGTVQNVGSAGGNWYLNFGEDYKTDFTAFIKAADYRAHFEKQDLKALTGKKLLLRGWIYERDGAMMDLVLPEQIEQ